MLAAHHFGGIELAGKRRSLADEVVVRDAAGGDLAREAVALVGGAGAGLGALQPPEPEAQHDRGSKYPEPGRGEGRGAEERHRDRVLDGGRAGHGRHGEGGGAQRDRRGHQPMWNVGRLEQGMPHGSEHEERDEQADAAIGDDGARQHHGQDGAPRSEPGRHRLRDDLDRAARLHQFAEQGAEQEDGEELRQEIGGAAHEDLCPARQHRLARQQGGEDGAGRCEQQDAPAAIGEEDQQAECDENPEKPHRSDLFQDAVEQAADIVGRALAEIAGMAGEECLGAGTAFFAKRGRELAFRVQLRRCVELDHLLRRDAVEAHIRPLLGPGDVDVPARRCEEALEHGDAPVDPIRLQTGAKMEGFETLMIVNS